MPDAADSSRPAPSVEAELVILSGPDAGTTHPVRQRAVLGRSLQCDIALSGERVSRVHAEIVRSHGGYCLRDLQSSNGTTVNGRRVQEADLHPGDEIEVGGTRLRFRIREPAAPGASVPAVRFHGGPPLERGVRVPASEALLTLALSQADPATTERLRERLRVLERITLTLSTLHDLREVYPLIVEQVLQVVPAERAVLFRRDSQGRPEPCAVRTTERDAEAIDVSDTIVNSAIEERQCILSEDALHDSRIERTESIVTYGIRSVLCVPVQFGDEVLGALYLDAVRRVGAFTEEDLRFVSSVAGTAAVAIQNALALEDVRESAAQLNRAYLSMLAVLANAIEARDHYTIGHTWRVTRFAQVIARRLGWSEEKIEELEVGGVLHDVGKIGVPDAILRKPAPLNAEEYEKMKRHPEIGARMLRDVPSLQHIIPYVLHHQEQWDGNGYPAGLRGEEIPIEARLLAVADTLDAMTSARPYHRGVDAGPAIAEIDRMAGVQFDPTVVEALKAAHAAGELEPYLQAGVPEDDEVLCPFCSTYFTPTVEVRDGTLVACPTCERTLRLRRADERTFAELA